MKPWNYVLIFFITPLGVPVTFALWTGLFFPPGNLGSGIASIPKFALVTLPAAYGASFVLAIPAVYFLLRSKKHIFSYIIVTGSLIGSLTGISAGFIMGGYDLSGMLQYWPLDLASLYVPSVISGFVCSLMYWTLTSSMQKRRRDL